MFDQMVARATNPPEPVLVKPMEVWPPDRSRWATATPLLVQAQGLQLRDPVLGVLRGWVRTQCGDWLAHVDFVICVQGVRFHLSSMIPMKSIKPTEEGVRRREGWPDPADA